MRTTNSTMNFSNRNKNSIHKGRTTSLILILLIFIINTNLYAKPNEIQYNPTFNVNVFVKGHRNVSTELEQNIKNELLKHKEITTNPNKKEYEINILIVDSLVGKNKIGYALSIIFVRHFDNTFLVMHADQKMLQLIDLMTVDLVHDDFSHIVISTPTNELKQRSQDIVRYLMKEHIEKHKKQLRDTLKMINDFANQNE